MLRIPRKIVVDAYVTLVNLEPVHTYRAFDLFWHSRGLGLPELPSPIGLRSEDHGQFILIQPEPASQWPELPTGPYDTPFLQMNRGDLRLTMEGIGRFRIFGGDRISWEREQETVSEQDLRLLLLGSAVGALLIQRGMLVLHGNALERDGRAIVCMGHSGAGKSTLAYALMEQGWRLLADDLVAITPEGQVLPGIPRIKLWHDAAKAFGLETEELPPIRQGLDKYLLMGEAVQPASAAVPLVALYLLNRRGYEQAQGDASRITRITSQKLAAMLLRNQAFRPQFVRGLGQEGANFIALAQLQQSVPLATLPLPATIAAMREWLKEQNLLQAATEAEGLPEETEGA